MEPLIKSSLWAQKPIGERFPYEFNVDKPLLQSVTATKGRGRPGCFGALKVGRKGQKERWGTAVLNQKRGLLKRTLSAGA